MAIPIRALIVEDSQNDCDLLLGMLDRGGYEVTHTRVCSAATLLAVLDEAPWDIVISDYSMPGFKGTDALAMIRKKGLDVPFVFLSGTIGEEIAVNAMRAGAQDYVIKGDAARLLPAIQRELREADARRERKQIRSITHKTFAFMRIRRNLRATSEILRVARGRFRRAIAANPKPIGPTQNGRWRVVISLTKSSSALPTTVRTIKQTPSTTHASRSAKPNCH